MLNEIYPTTGAYGLGVFVLVTLVMGGAAAIATGRAIAATWRPLWQVAVYAALLAAVARFLQYALFHQPLLSLPNYLIDATLLLALAFLGHRLARVRQMTAQYPWAFAPVGRLGWRPRGDGTASRP